MTSEGGGKGPRFAITVLNLNRSRPIGRRRYTRGGRYFIYRPPLRPDPRPGALPLTSMATSSAHRWQPRLLGLHRLASTRTRSRMRVRSPPLRPFSPVRHSGVRHLQRGRRAAMAGGSSAPSLASSFACHQARARHTFSSPLFLRRWINWCPDSRSMWASPSACSPSRGSSRGGTHTARDGDEIFRFS